MRRGSDFSRRRLLRRMRPERPEFQTMIPSTKEAPMSANQHALFVVGRISKGERRMIFLRSTPAPPPFTGPFELRAVFVI